MIGKEINTNDGFFNWLAGFIDGEGCFRICLKKGPQPNPRPFCLFALFVRADEEPIVREIKRKTGLGAVSHRKALSDRWAPTVGWSISVKPECLALVRLLDEYPLRAKKAQDYAIWREAVLAWHEVRRGPIHELCPAQVRMVELRTELKRSRVYRGAP